MSNLNSSGYDNNIGHIKDTKRDIIHASILEWLTLENSEFAFLGGSLKLPDEIIQEAIKKADVWLERKERREAEFKARAKAKDLEREKKIARDILADEIFALQSDIEKSKTEVARWRQEAETTEDAIWERLTKKIIENGQIEREEEIEVVYIVTRNRNDGE